MSATVTVPELATALARVDAHLTRVDAKASTLLSLVAALAGAAMAAASVLAGRGTLPLPAIGTAWAVAAALVAAAGVLLRVVRPTLIRNGHGLIAWASPAATADQLLHQLTTPHRPRQDAVELQVLAQLAVAKYRRLRLAVDLTAAGLVLAAATAVTAVLTGAGRG